MVQTACVAPALPNELATTWSELVSVAKPVKNNAVNSVAVAVPVLAALSGPTVNVVTVVAQPTAFTATKVSTLAVTAPEPSVANAMAVPSATPAVAEATVVASVAHQPGRR